MARSLAGSLVFGAGSAGVATKQRTRQGRNRVFDDGVGVGRRLRSDGEHVLRRVCSAAAVAVCGAAPRRRQVREHLADVGQLQADLLVDDVDLVHVRVAAGVGQDLLGLLDDFLRQPLAQNGPRFAQNLDRFGRSFMGGRRVAGLPEMDGPRKVDLAALARALFITLFRRCGQRKRLAAESLSNCWAAAGGGDSAAS